MVHGKLQLMARRLSYTHIMDTVTEDSVRDSSSEENYRTEKNGGRSGDRTRGSAASYLQKTVQFVAKPVHMVYKTGHVNAQVRTRVCMCMHM